jgi:hypothetical protein
VLKITEIGRNDSGRRFKLEGTPFGPWVDELRNVCMQPLDRLENRLSKYFRENRLSMCQETAGKDFLVFPVLIYHIIQKNKMAN